MFVIMFMARSGSKFLQKLLNQHPDVKDFGEAFHDRSKNFRDQTKVLERFASIALGGANRNGFQFRYPRHTKEFPEIFKVIEDNASGDLKLILLKRRNVLKGAISQQNAEWLKRQTGKAHLFLNSEQSYHKQKVDVDRAIREAYQREQLDSQYASWAMSSFSCIEVFYEDLCSNTYVELSRICSHLGISHFKAESLRDSGLVKVTPDNLSDAIQNYGELKQAVIKKGRPEWLDLGVSSSKFPGGTRASGSSYVKKLSDISQIIGRKLKGRSLYQESVNTVSGGKFRLVAEALRVRTNTLFLEHKVIGESDVVIASQGNDILVSYDSCERFERWNVGKQFRKCFTTDSGYHLLQQGNGCIYRFDADWALVNESQTGQFPWHGSWSIDQNDRTGTIIWAEYPYASKVVRVWRSVDDGISWKECFSAEGHSVDPKGGDIRHFHLVQKCSLQSGVWYLSSGDTTAQSKFWISSDDGLSWQQQPIAEVVGDASCVPEGQVAKLHRFTAMVQTDNKLVWATDDTFHGQGAKVCVMNKESPRVVKVLEGDCGLNEIRNLIQLDSNHALAVSESKLDKRSISLTLINLREELIETTVKIANPVQKKSNFMNGVSSKKALGSCFYSRTDNIILRPSPMTTRWWFEIS